MSTPTHIGPYRILGELGRGGMGAVYRARRDDLDREFALKVVLPEFAGDADVRARFDREARSAARLADVPGIAGVVDVGEFEGQPYLAMELVEGGSLEEVIDGGDLTPERSAALIEQAARAVQAAHDRGVLHRDIKPGNLLLTTTGDVRVADFGLARPTNVDSATAKLTRTGMVLGTPAYMPPEQAQGLAVDGRADVYALGATLYEALIGEVPFPGDSMFAVLGALLRDPAPRPRRRDPRVPRDLETIVLRCLEKRPEDRYADAGALADDLARFQAGESVLARPIPAWRRFGRALQRRRLAVALALVVAGAAGAAVAVQSWSGGQAAQDDASVEAATGERDNAELAQEISAAYFALARDTAEPMAVLEDAVFGVAPAPAVTAAALEQIVAITEQVGRDHPRVGVARAWLGVAQFLAGRQPEGEAAFLAALKHAPTDPFVTALWARAHLGTLAREIRPPAPSWGDGRVEGIQVTLPPNAANVLVHTQRALTAAGDSPLWDRLTHGREYRAYREGAAALAKQDYAAAAEHLAPLCEHPQLAAEAGMLRGLALFMAGDPDAALLAWEGPARRGWLVAVSSQAVSLINRAVLAAGNGGDADTPLREAIALLESVPPAVRNYGPIRAQRGSAWLMRAKFLRRRGGDPRAMLERAETEIRAAVKTMRPAIQAQLMLAGVLLERGRLAEDRADAAGLQAAAEAVKIYNAILALSGGNPGGKQTVLTNRAAAHLLLGRMREVSGQEGIESFRAGLEDCEQVVAMGDPPLATLTARTQLRARLISNALDRGTDTTDLLAALRRDCDAVEAVDPTGAPGQMSVAFCDMLHARAAKMQGQDSRPHLREALKRYVRVLEVRPQWIRALLDIADSWQALADAELGAGGDPFPPMEEALRAYQRALGRGLHQVRALTNRALVYQTRAQIRLARGEDPGPDLKLGLADLEAALALEPGRPPALAARAGMRFFVAEAARAAGRDARPALRVALADIERALALDARRASHWQTRASICYRLGDLEQRAKGDYLPIVNKALESYDRAIEVSPRHAYYRHMRGLTLLWLRRVDDAIGALETAVRLEPNSAEYRRALDAAKDAQARGR